MSAFQHWGEIDHEGATIRDTQICAITGQIVRRDEGVQVFVAETHLFYRLSRQARNDITQPQRADIEEKIRSAKQLGIAAEFIAAMPEQKLEWTDPEDEPKSKKGSK